MSYPRQTTSPLTEFNEALNSVEETPCQSLPDIFFPEDMLTKPAERDAIQLAKAMCADCPIRIQCLLYAVQTKQTHGIWGGTTPKER